MSPMAAGCLIGEHVMHGFMVAARKHAASAGLVQCLGCEAPGLPGAEATVGNRSNRRLAIQAIQ